MNHFYELAKPLIERGLAVIPLHPHTKTPACSWKHFRIWNLDILAQKAKDFADKEVAVVSSRGLDHPVFIDFDDESVIPRIEQDTGRTIPATFKIQTRPKSAPMRQHHIWSQTAYSLKRFRFDKAKNVNVRDVHHLVESPSGGKMFKTLYDLKGVGGSSYIVGAGSVSKSGETYTIFDNSAVAPIPDWLVDWLVDDIAKYRRDWKGMNARKEKEKLAAAKMSAEQRADRRAQGHADGFEINREDLHDFVLSLLKKFSAMGLSGDVLEHVLTAEIRQRVQGGEEYVASQRGMDSIRRRVASEPVRDIGASFYEKRKNKPFDDSGLIMTKELTKRDILQSIIGSFPDRLSGFEAESQIDAALRGVGMKFDKRKDRDNLSVVRRRLGFSVVGSDWIRLPEEPSPPSSYTDKRTDMSVVS
jgi:hypothetical protein